MKKSRYIKTREKSRETVLQIVALDVEIAKLQLKRAKLKEKAVKILNRR